MPKTTTCQLRTIKYLLLCLAFWSCHSTGKLVKNKLATDKAGFIQFEQFELRDKPLLNREYISFLCWYMDVYGLSYPEKVLSVLPAGAYTSTTDFGDDFGFVLEHLETGSPLRNYTLNPQYLNYPMTGLSDSQIMEVFKSMTDRYNENLLIEAGYFYFNPEQKDEDCFVTESFLVEQYMGDLRREVPLDWNEPNYKPTFRLPYSDELEQAHAASVLDNELQAYPFASKDFLWRWDDYYLQERNETSLTLLINGEEVIITRYQSASELLERSYTNGHLLDRSNELVNTRYFQLDFSVDYPYDEKDYDGRMDFVVVGVDDANRPILADRLIMGHSLYASDRIFHIALNKVIPEDYLPD